VDTSQKEIKNQMSSSDGTWFRTFVAFQDTKISLLTSFCKSWSSNRVRASSWDRLPRDSYTTSVKQVCWEGSVQWGYPATICTWCVHVQVLRCLQTTIGDPLQGEARILNL